MKEAASPLGKLVRSERERLGLTQAQLAERCGLDRVEINALENGRNKATSARIRDALMRGLGIPVVTITELSRAEPPTPKLRTLRQLPGWREADQVARAFARDMPAQAFDAVGEMQSMCPPEVITPTVVLGFARAWWDAASDATRKALHRKEPHVASEKVA